MNSPSPAPRLALLLDEPRGAGKRPAIRRYKLGRVVRDVDMGAHMLPSGAPASGVRSP